MAWLNNIQREISVSIVEECVTLQIFHQTIVRAERHAQEFEACS